MQKHTRRSTRAAFAESTSKNLRSQWKSYLLFCFYFNLTPFPATSKVLAWFAQLLSRSMTAIDTVRNYISGVKLLHVLLDLSCDGFSGFEVKLAIRGLARLNPHKRRQPLPITPAILYKIHAQLDFTVTEDLVWWVVFLLSFFLMARKSNMVPNSVYSFDGNKQLLAEDIVVGHGSLLVHLKWSKTNQFGTRRLLIPLVRIPGSVLCPVRAVKLMRETIHFHPKAPAFAVPGRTGLVPLTYLGLTKKLRAVLNAAGLDASLYSSHSFRRGAASYAFSVGVNPLLIQLQGDWVSDSYRRYLEFEVSKRASVSRQIRGAILKHV